MLKLEWENPNDGFRLFYHSILLTLSPLEFQQTSKMPPVPLYECTSCPFWVLQMWTHLVGLKLLKLK